MTDRAAVVVGVAARRTFVIAAHLVLWALSLGFCAIVLAAIAYFMNGDATGAGGILAGAAAIIAVVVHLGAEREETGGEN